ncbi:MAG: hypothetical protein GY711_08660 [bacterium]|nr:hypothetical protein [bacterium]
MRVPLVFGNPSFTVGVQGALGGANALVVCDVREPLLGSHLAGVPRFAWTRLVLDGAGAGDGTGSVSLALPGDPALIGTELFGRWYVRDAAAAGGFAATALFTATVF